MIWRVWVSMAIQSHCLLAFFPPKLPISSASAYSCCPITSPGLPGSCLEAIHHKVHEPLDPDAGGRADTVHGDVLPQHACHEDALLLCHDARLSMQDTRSATGLALRVLLAGVKMLVPLELYRATPWAPLSPDHGSLLPSLYLYQLLGHCQVNGPRGRTGLLSGTLRSFRGHVLIPSGMSAPHHPPRSPQSNRDARRCRPSDRLAIGGPDVAEGGAVGGAGNPAGSAGPRGEPAARG